MTNKKTLILLPDCFPFKAFEPYLENEFTYLEKAYDKIYIFSASDNKSPIYKLPQHVKYFSFPFSPDLTSKLKAVLLFNPKIFRTERQFVNSILKQKFDLEKIKVMIMEYYKALLFKRYIKNVMQLELHNSEDVCVYSYWCDYKAISAALLKKEYPKIKAVSRAHGWDVYFERHNSGYLPLRTYIFDTLERIYFISENGKEYTSMKYNDPSKFAVFHLGTNTYSKPNFSKARKPFHIVSCSSIIPLKRIHLLIKALALLPEDIDIKWTHLGEGVLFDEMLRLSKDMLANKFNIHYEFKGHIGNNEVLKFYSENNVNVLVNTSATEGLPMTMMEAMSNGVPVIGTNVGGVKEIISNENNGFMLSANPEPKEISETIECFIKMNDETYSGFCRYAFDTWNSKFNAEINFPKFINELVK